MSGHPIWVTDAGSLGVVPEGKFYHVSLEAYDPEFPVDPSKVTYSLIAGALPAGIQLDINGTIEGIPISVADFKGVPIEVSENTTSKFAVRVIDEDDRIADRTFTLTVSGQDAPEFITPPGTIGEYFDGSELEFQFEVSDSDPDDIITVTQIGGTIPPGTSISSSGLFSGFLEPVPELSGATQGWDNTLFDEYPLDFSTQSLSLNYQFTLQASDGKDVSIRTFEVFVFSRSSMTVDSIEFTVDNTNITVDSIASRSPYLLEHEENIGIFRHDNFFAHQFIGSDPDGEIVEYVLRRSSTSNVSLITVDSTELTVDNDIITVDNDESPLPGTLTLNSETGWITGVIDNIGLTETQFDFGILVRRVDNPEISSRLYDFSMTVIGDIEQVTWITPSDLGTISNGAISTFTIEAFHENSDLEYSLAAGGVYSKLPQGLKLLPSGNIIGRTSFKMFSLDGGKTTFDSEYETRLSVDPTTFDSLFKFTVVANSPSGFVSLTKEFTILVIKRFDIPHNFLYCNAMSPLADRDLLDTLLLNSTVLNTELIYRVDDPNFGTAKRITYQHAFGLSPTSIADYFAALDKNHYNKVLTLGNLKTARALNSDETVLYEVVYSEIIDDLVNQDGQSISPIVIDNNTQTELYPNSLENMREQLISQIGQESNVLPRWMLSKQENGEVLGFTPAWIIAYAKPEKGELLKYKINEFFGDKINLIDFEIDRYELDQRLARDWDLDNQEWLEGVLTTFGRSGEPYITPVVPTDGESIWAMPKVLGPFDNVNETIFDGGSCRFTAPVDVYDASDDYDRYIKFPQTRII